MKQEYPIIRLKREIEEAYGGIYAPYAAKWPTNGSRKFEEKAYGFENRSGFQRDRDRIIHSSAFRRMMYKTQVFVNHEGDQFRTRLTHSLEVAQFARGIAKSLALNEELAEAIALGHDLGHTPFGHAAEGVFSKKLQQVGLPGFFHNEQSLRVVDMLENRKTDEYQGLNLTREVREGILKHNGDRTGEFSQLKPYTVCSTIEGQLIKLVDTVAYTCHDLDDGIKSGILEKNCKCNEDMRAHFESIKELILNETGIEISYDKYDNLNFISKLINYFVEKITYSTYDNLVKYNIESIIDVEKLADENVSIADVSEETMKLFLRFKKFVNDTLYNTTTVQMMDYKAERVVGELYDAFFQNTDLLPPEWKYKLDNYSRFNEYNFQSCDKIKARLICDYISCMTDRFALEEHDRVFNPKVKI